MTDTKQTRPWQPPVMESAEERNKREQRDQQTRFFVEVVKEALRQFAEERKAGESENIFDRLFGF